MNNYKEHADSLRKIVDRVGHDEELDRMIKIYDLLGELTQEEKYELYNSGAFNEITRIYTTIAMQNIGIEDELIDKVMKEIDHLQDTMTAREMLC